MIMDGEFDHLPEAAFNLVGTIEDAFRQRRKDDGRSSEINQRIMHLEIITPTK